MSSQATCLHILTITDQQGVIQVRAHDPQAIGVNIATNPLVRAGLRGKAASRMTQVQDGIALSASAPITFQDRVTGVVLTGILIDKSFVESLSLPGAEVAVFYGDRLVVNSFKDLPEGAMASLKKLKDMAPLTNGLTEHPQSLDLGDQAYTVAYLPLEGEEKPGENLIVVGVNRNELAPTLSALKLAIFGVGGASALIGALLSYWLSLGMRRQIALLADATRRPPGRSFPATSRWPAGLGCDLTA